MKKLVTIALAVVAMVATTQSFAQGRGPAMANMQVTSKAFEDGGKVPVKYSNYGDKVMPDFTITGAPDTAVSYAVIFHDIEVAIGGNTGDVTHWVAYNIPSPMIPEGKLPEGSMQGKNITGQLGYMGPGAPMVDRFHHYVFEFYALSAKLDLKEGATRDEVMAAMQGKVVGKAAYVGRFAKPATAK